ncbi:ABC-2 family transporter protein [Actinomyces bovis]|uniref:ABC-2 family transporter protein n=1 Tax=Actinomyces bovis TaxID=1658 RepID=A0ABY1VMB0_9ACTO|nr:ABC transporter permease [Actinomyces bovis]SPT52817.1 ABC-2 family transporter protein [Actinomyces bovis]VEG54873.1 ABC-2 family transporter protein [Actinomyces israelii]
MTTFRTSLRIVAGHWLYVLIYLLLLSQIGLWTGLAMGTKDSGTLSEEHAQVAVIDHDGSVISQGLRHYLESTGEPVQVAEDRPSMQDAIAQERAEYILVVSANYGQSLTQAAATGAALPELQAAIAASSGDGQLMDQRTNIYLNQVYGYLAAGVMTPEQAVAAADRNIQETATAQLIKNQSGAIPEGLVIYAKMSTYPLLAFTSVIIATLMASLNQRAVRSRTLASPEASRSRALGLLGACLVIGVVGWLWIYGLGLVVFGLPLLSKVGPLLGIVGLSLGAYTLVGVALGFLMGRIGVSQNWTDAIANIGGMVFSFLGGAWVPTSLLPAGVVAVSKFTPAYWSTAAIQGAYESLSLDAATLRPLLVNCGLCALFAVALGCVALMVGRTRARASL